METKGACSCSASQSTQPATLETGPNTRPLSVIQTHTATQSPSTVPKKLPPQTQADTELSEEIRRALPELSVTARRAIKLNPLDPEKETTAKFHVMRSGIYPSSLRALLNTHLDSAKKWLCDIVIDGYLEGLMVRATSNQHLPRIYCYPYYFCHKWYTSEKNFEAVKCFAKNIDVFNLDIVLFPILLKESRHWILMAVFPKRESSSVMTRVSVTIASTD